MKTIILIFASTLMLSACGGGGGSGTSPGGGGTGDTEDSALATLGEGDADAARAEARFVGQSTGVTGGELPVEFRAGLDAYFATLEAANVIQADDAAQ